LARDRGALFDSAHSNRSGDVASYIPELEKVDADLFGISVVTIDGVNDGLKVGRSNGGVVRMNRAVRHSPAACLRDSLTIEINNISRTTDDRRTQGRATNSSRAH